MIHRIWNYNFDDIYILFHERIYTSILFTIIILILDTRCYPAETWVIAILIHCLLPPDEYQFYTINFNRNEIFLKNWFTQNIISIDFPPKNFTIAVIVFILDSTCHTRGWKYSWDYSGFKDWQTDRRSHGERIGTISSKGLAQKLIRFRPSDLKRFESWSLAISVRVLNLNAESRGERISFFHHVFPTVENSTVLFLSGIMREPSSCFPSSLLLEKVSPPEINALPFAAQSFRPKRSRELIVVRGISN